MTRWAKRPPIKPERNISLFDQAQRKAQEGIEVSYRHADSYWKDAVSQVVRELALTCQEFNTDLVWLEMDKLGIYTGENRALGAIIQAAHRSGMIQPTGQYKPSYRRHNAPIITWHSNIYGRTNHV
jgi:hypothetical protein